MAREEMDMAARAVEIARQRGAIYADARIVDRRSRAVSVKNDAVSEISENESLGIGVRALQNGTWGFAACDDLTHTAVEHTAVNAVVAAETAAVLRGGEINLVAAEPIEAEWETPYKIDPFLISIEDNVNALLAINRELAAVAGVTLGESSMNFRREEQWFASSSQTRIHQTKYTSGAGLVVHAYSAGELHRRSYPDSWGGLWQNKGYELIHDLKLLESAPVVAEQAVQLLKADNCPEGTFDVILDGSQMAMQIHESIGHALELDRVLGYEANFAGRSFATVDKLGKLRYGSNLLNIVADARQEHGGGLGTFGFDDEGVPAQRTPLITDGWLSGYMTSRETARAIGLGASGGTMRADGSNRIPLIRMTNVSILPQEIDLTLEQLIAESSHAILMQTNRSWSIDDKRQQFQFGCEIGWEIRNGKRVRLVRNPSYSGVTVDFWNRLDAICSQDEWRIWGNPYCAKGQPQQIVGTGHGTVPARFRDIAVRGSKVT